MSTAPPAAPRPPCPGDTDIASFVSGVIDPDKIPGLEQHLVDCPRCHRLVAELARDSIADDAADNGAPPPRQTIPQPQTFEAPRTLQVGERVGNRYDIRRFIARGGMGEVYLAHDTILDDVVALKTLLVTSLDDERAADRLKEEVLVARRVSHTNVCRLLEFGVHQKTGGKGLPALVPYLTMEMLQGQTLRARLQDRGPLSTTDALPVVGQILDALAAIHAARIVHRDLKCENVFLVPLPDGGERVVVTDLGLARELATGRRRFETGGATVGTVDYMAPEQIDGQPAAPTFDIYALGVVLFHMMTGRMPFDGGTALSAAARRLTVPAPRLGQFVPGIDSRWENVIARCLERDPARRFASVAQIQAALAETIPTAVLVGARRRMAILGSVGVAAAAILLLGPGRNRATPQVARPAETDPRNAPRDTPGPRAARVLPAPTSPTPIATPQTVSDDPESGVRAVSAPKHARTIVQPARPLPTPALAPDAQPATPDAGALPAPTAPPATPLRPRRHPDDVVYPFAGK